MVEDRYEKLYQQSVTAILSADRTGLVVDCNRAACRLLARQRSELVGTPLLQWVAPRERRQAKQRFLDVLDGMTAEWRSGLLRPDGSSRYVHIRCVPCADDPDRIDALVWDPGRSADASAGEPLRQLLENLPGQFCLVLDEDARIRYARGLARTHWRNDAELIGADLGVLVSSARESGEQFAALRQAIGARQPWSGRLSHERADGSTFDVVVYAVPHCDVRNGGRRGALLVGRDVSEESSLRARAERAERLAGIGAVVGSIAHELQRPLHALRAMLPDAAPDAPIRLELERMAVMVDKLDAFASNRAPDLRSVAVRELVDEAIRSEAPTLERAGAAVTNEVPAELPPLPGDRAHIARALQELIANAAEAVAGAGSREIRVGAAVDGERMLVHVHDTGTGIEAERIGRVLEPFYTTRPGRLGVGLALAHGVASAHGGRVSVHSAGAGAGTTATLELPSRQRHAPVPFRAVPLVLRSLSVLVVDDDAAVRAVIRRVLERVGYIVSEAFSGRSALALLATDGAPDLLVTDLKMTGGTGVWLLERIGREYAGLLDRTVIITGDPSDVAIAGIAARTGCPVLRKPVEFSQLLEVLDEVALRAAAHPRRA